MPRLLALAALLALVIAATASATADRQTVMSATAPTFAWDGPVSSSLAPTPSEETCTNPAPGRYCDRTLIELKEPGTLLVDIGEWNEDSDMDLFLVESDADGTFGEEIVNSLNSGTDPEKVTAKLEPGFYLVFVNYFQAVNSGYKGKAAFKSAAPVTGTTPAPTQSPAPTTTSGSAGSPGTLPPSGTLAVDMVVDKSKLKTLRSKGAAVRVGCTVTCKGTLTMKLGTKTVGRASFTRTQKEHPPTVIKLSKKAKKKLARAKQATLRISAVVTDASGGQRQTIAKGATYKR